MAAFGWKPLPAFSKDVPPLLVLPEFGASSYILYITDLSNIWTESLGKDEILRRSGIHARSHKGAADRL